jgi:GGDEF domain-containing protein
VAARTTGLPTSVSSGAATARPGQSLSEVLSAADAAMYATKAARRLRHPAGPGPVPVDGDPEPAHPG